MPILLSQDIETKWTWSLYLFLSLPSFSHCVLQIRIEKRGKRERKQATFLEATRNNFAFGRRLWGDSVNFNVSYSHSLVCIGKRVAWGLGDFLTMTAGSSESLAAAQTCKVSDKCCHCKTFLFLLAAWLYSCTVEAQTGNPLQQICRGLLQCCWRSASWRPGKQRGAAIQKCFANLEKWLNFPGFISLPFLSPEAWQAVLTGPFFLCTQHTPTLKILLKRENLFVIKCLGKWLLLNTSEGVIHSATIHNNITCCTASEILELFLLHRGRNER